MGERASDRVDAQRWAEVNAFRKAERTRLYAERKAAPVAQNAEAAARIARELDDLLPDLAGQTVAAYWPIRGELDLRGWCAGAIARGARIGLPVVVTSAAPVEFHHWTPESKMGRGVWNIPVPLEAEVVRPDVVLVPLLGVDRLGYRLGNGGGYYDRTLALLPEAMTIGVGQGFAVMETIHPMPWDIGMKRVVLGDGAVQAFDR